MSNEIRPVEKADVDNLGERVKRVEERLQVELDGRDARERDVASALDRTQVAIGALERLAERPELVGKLTRLEGALAAAERLFMDLDELTVRAAELGDSLSLLVDRATRLVPLPWWRRLLRRRDA